jgi:hypothetical protein
MKRQFGQFVDVELGVKKFAGGESSTLIMMFEAEFLNEWGIWFCFQAEASEANENYYMNFQQVYNLRAPADLAYLWNNYQLNNLENFLLKSNNKQNTYPSRHAAS